MTERGITGLSLALGVTVPFARWFPGTLMPAALAQTPTACEIEGKTGCASSTTDRFKAETPPHLLDDDITPTARLFVRNNGLAPDIARKQDATGRALQIDGEVDGHGMGIGVG